MQKIKKILIIALTALGVVSFQPAASIHAQVPDNVRVAIVQDAESIGLKVRGFFLVKGDNQLLYKGRDLNCTVRGLSGGVSLGGKNFKAKKIFIDADEEDGILINGRNFRGEVEFLTSENAKFSVVNYVGLEDYVKGILYHEVSHYWPMEVLKAQAIVCRTYAVYQMQQNKSKDFDVTCDIYSQVYGGLTSERERPSRAVDFSRDLVLKFQGKIFPAYFHATCAGHTEDASLLWNIDLAPLKGVVCKYCQESPHFNWHYVLSAEEAGQKLSTAGYKTGPVKNISILGRDASGRVTDLKIASANNTLKISAKDFRNIIGPNIIKSANFTLSLAGNDIIFEGIGWGHGVGMCQWGAYFMAKEGRTAEEILKYYYPGSEITAIIR